LGLDGSGDKTAYNQGAPSASIAFQDWQHSQDRARAVYFQNWRQNWTVGQTKGGASSWYKTAQVDCATEQTPTRAVHETDD
jgi:hypothetical protein